MTDKELRKLKREELLEIMLAQSREIDRLKSRIAQLEKELHNKNIRIREAGSIADAALAITNIFEEAQRAADLYVLNVKKKAEAGIIAEGTPADAPVEEPSEGGGDAEH